MDSVDKCCFSIRLNVAPVVLEIGSIFVSLVLIITSILYICLEEGTPHHLQLFTVDITEFPAMVILVSVLSLGIVLMIVSVLLILGVRMNKSGYVLSYFGFGIFLSIFLLLCGLLLLLGNHWILALIIFITSIIYIHFLVVVHNVYERMLAGKSCGTSEVDLEEDLISVGSMDTTVES